MCESISRQLTGWAVSLQQSPVEGRRYYTPQKAAERAGERSRRQFIERLEAIRQGRSTASDPPA